METKTQDRKEQEKFRLNLLANGYTPLPNIGKLCVLKGWPTKEINEDVVRSWTRQSGRVTTGVRLQNGLAVLDFDLANADAMEAVAVELEAVFGDFALRKTTGKVSEAWFFRTPEPFSRMATRKWVDKYNNTNQVEAYGGAGARQFGVLGPHTIKDGNVEKWYDWEGDSLLDTPLDELPLVDKETVADAIAAANVVLEGLGYEQVPELEGVGSADRLYTLTDDMTFMLDTGESDVTLVELKDRAFVDEKMRCAAYPWLEDNSAHTNTSRVMVGTTRDGFVCLYDHQTEILYLEESAKGYATASPVELQEKMKQLEQLVGKGETSSKLEVGGDVEENGLKLTKMYAWWAEGSGYVVPLDVAPDGSGCMSLSGFKNTLGPYEEVAIGPRGGMKTMSPVSVWRSSPDRRVIGGLQMRPEMSYPTFVEDGREWVNTYRPQDHSMEGGDATMFYDFLSYLLPVKREYNWFVRWLAFKMQNSGVPGQAVVMVAKDFGVGRGTLKAIMERLFGAAYTSSPSFDTLAAQTYQGQYNDWMTSSLMAFTQEAEASDPSGGSYAARKSQYEALKEVADPNARWTRVNRKTLPNHDARVCTSLLIATQHRDAIQLAPGDRRFVVLTNGRNKPDTDPFWAKLHKCLDDPANHAAFARSLLSMDLGDFDSRKVFDTPGKQIMIDMARTDIDRAFDRMVEETDGELFTHTHVSKWIAGARDRYGYHFPAQWPAVVRRLTERNLHEVYGTLAEVNAAKLVVYAKTPAAADAWQGKDPSTELAKNTPEETPSVIGKLANLGDYR